MLKKSFFQKRTRLSDTQKIKEGFDIKAYLPVYLCRKSFSVSQKPGEPEGFDIEVYLLVY